MLGRTQTNNASDYGNVHAIQKGFHLMPLSLYPDGQKIHLIATTSLCGGGKVGRYGTDYVARAFTARIGLGALPPEDATYKHCHQDSADRALDGSHQYRMHFEKSEIPPVRAFWSVTMYSEDGYFVPNAIDASRSAIVIL